MATFELAVALSQVFLTTFIRCHRDCSRGSCLLTQNIYEFESSGAFVLMQNSEVLITVHNLI